MTNISGLIPVPKSLSTTGTRIICHSKWLITGIHYCI